MNDPRPIEEIHGEEDGQIIQLIGYDFGFTRRRFVAALGAGILIAAAAPAAGQSRPTRQRGNRGGGAGGGGRGRQNSPVPLDARLHIGKDGTMTVLSGKVECGQGARAELTQAAAEELRVPVDRIQMMLADTGLTPDDGITAGSRTTPSTVPAVRQACAAARELLAKTAAKKWDLALNVIDVRDGAAIHDQQKFTYADLAAENPDNLKQLDGPNASLTATGEWKILGTPALRPNRRDIVTGSHRYPYDVKRPGMVYGKILRPPAYGAKLKDIDLAAAKAMEGVTPMRDGNFVGVVAPTTHQAKLAIVALEKTAQWDEPETQVSSKNLYEHLRANARDEIARKEFIAASDNNGPISLHATYNIAYVQHAPMEPRAAVAEWQDGKLTVWTSTQNPFGVRRELAGAFHISEDKIRVVVPDFGGGFGGKHTGETAVEAARLAQGAGKPVALRWTRQEEFTWAAFRPAGVIDVEAALRADGKLARWSMVNINSGPSAVETPYRIAEKPDTRYVQSAPPLRHSSYRALAATANNFARECFMDELAHAAGRDPLEFRLAHLENDRLRAVLEAATKEFNWSERVKNKSETSGVGLACGEEKGSFVAACAEVAIDRAKGTIAVRHACQAFECGAITNPRNLESQVQGAIVMGLGPALRERMEFERGRITNATFFQYEVPRFADVPEIRVHLVNRPDLPPAGAGEIPLIAIAPAIGNAVFHATATRLREIPMKLPTT